MSAAAGATASGVAAEHMMSSRYANPLPRIFCCAVVYGSMIVSSSSRPEADWPFGASTPTTRRLWAPMRTSCPTALAAPKSCSRTVRPIRHTSAPFATSWSVNASPSAICQRRMSR